MCDLLFIFSLSLCNLLLFSFTVLLPQQMPFLLQVKFSLQLNTASFKRTELENFPQRTNTKIAQIHVSLNAKVKEYNYNED